MKTFFINYTANIEKPIHFLESMKDELITKIYNVFEQETSGKKIKFYCNYYQTK